MRMAVAAACEPRRWPECKVQAGRGALFGHEKIEVCRSDGCGESVGDSRFHTSGIMWSPILLLAEAKGGRPGFGRI
ncbi:hypothetical protein VO70_09530 [Aeromonas salmonicida]|nr:hypothetical protein VO70_09530 [Aeromonas salmonicida]